MKNKGFTLIELLGVIIILSLLMTLAFPSIVNLVKNSSDKTDDLTLDLIYNASNLFIADHQNEFFKYNGNKYIIELKDLIDEGFLVPPIKLSDSNSDITNKKCVQVTYNNGYKYDLKDIGTCEKVSVLPEEYQKVEYIESTGTQYIITNYVPNYNSKIYFKFTTTKQLADEFNCLIGSGLVNATNTNWGYSVILESSTSELKFRSYSNTLNSTGKIINQNETHNYILEYGKLTCDDVEYTGNTDLSTGNMSNLYIFARYFKESSSAGISKGKLYNFKVEENSVIKMNLIPCYRKEDNVIGMYDLVDNVFYTNSGTGVFEKGSDV